MNAQTPLNSFFKNSTCFDDNQIMTKHRFVFHFHFGIRFLVFWSIFHPKTNAINDVGVITI